MRKPVIVAALFAALLAAVSLRAPAQEDASPRPSSGDSSPSAPLLAELERADPEAIGTALAVAIEGSLDSEPWLDAASILEQGNGLVTSDGRAGLSVAAAWAASGFGDDATVARALAVSAAMLTRGDAEGLAAWPLSRWLLDPDLGEARRSDLASLVTLGRDHATSPLARARYDAVLARIADLAGRRLDAESLYGRAAGPMGKSLGANAVEALALRAARALNLAEMGEPERAAPALREALAGREQHTWDLRVRFPVGLDDLAQYHYVWGRTELAEELLRRAVDDYRAILGSDALEIAALEQLLADVLDAREAFGEALRHELVARELLAAKLEPNEPRVAVSDYRMKRLEAAIAIGERRLLEGAEIFIAADSLAQAAGIPSEHRAVELWRVGLVLLESGMQDPAGRLFERGLALFDGTWGAEVDAHTTALSAEAVTLTEREDFDEAEFIRRRVLEIQETVHGTNSVDYGRALADLGSLMMDRGDLAAGADLALQAIKILERRVGLVNHETLAAMNVLAGCYAGMGERSQAEPFFRRVLEIREQHFPEDLESLGTSQLNLGTVLSKLERLDEAEPLLRLGVDTYRKAFLEGSPEIGNALLRLGHVLDDSKRYAQAEAVYREALAILEPTLGVHSSVAWSHEYLGRTLVHQKRLEEARASSERAREILIAVWGERHPDVATVMSTLAMVAEDSGDLERAVELHHEVIAIRREHLGTRSHRLVDSYCSLSRVLLNQGKTAEAVGLLEEAFEIARLNYLPDDPRIDDTLNDLARALAADGDLDAASEIFDDLLESVDTSTTLGRQRLERIARRYADALRDAGRKKRAREIEGRYLARAPASN